MANQERRNILLGATLLAAAVASAKGAKAQTAPVTAGGLIEEIKKRGVLRLGQATFVPATFRSKSGQIVGHIPDLAQKLADDMGVKLEVTPTPFDGIIPALLSGKIDITIGMTVTPTRNLTVNFSNPTVVDGMHVVASKKAAAGFNRMEQFNQPSVTLVVRRATTGSAAAQKYFPKATLRQFDDDAQVMLELTNGRAHGFVTAYPRTVWAAEDNPDTLFIPFEGLFAKQANAIAYRKGDADATNFFNNWVQYHQMSGFLEERYQWWFHDRKNWKDLVQN